MQNIKSMLIFEMMGRPVEHLKETLAMFVDKISTTKGVKIISKSLNEPKRIEKIDRELYTTFTEIEADFDSLKDLMDVIFIYMPSHVEIVSPGEVLFKNYEMNSLINELVMKLHQYDELAKSLAIEKQILQKQLEEKTISLAGQKEEQKEKLPEKTKKKQRKKKS